MVTLLVYSVLFIAVFNTGLAAYLLYNLIKV
jgi:hypothetical protein